MGFLATHWRSVAFTAAALALLIVGPASIGAAPTGLVAAYSFDAGSGSTLADVSGNGRNGTISGAAWTSAGRNGGALSFDGVNDLVTVADAAGLDLSSGMTLEAWVRPTVAGSWRTVVTKEQSGNLVYGLFSNSDSAQPSGIVSVGPLQDIVRGPSGLVLSSWTHLATTYDGSVLRLYLNGVQVGTRNVSGAMPNSSQPLQIGGNNVWPEWFQGQLDDLRIYNRALSAAELVTDMNTPVGNASPPPSPDIQAPSAPTGLVMSGQSQTGLTLGWNASTDNVGVTGYSVYRDGSTAGSTAASTRTYTFSGLSCGTTYALGVDAADAAENRSARTTVNAATSACPAASRPVAAYSFNAGSGSTLADVSGNGRNGTISGAVWTSAGRNGGALSFDGMNDLVTVADSSSLDLTSGMTLEAWVRPTSSGLWRTVVTKEQSGNLVYGVFSSSDTGQPSGLVSVGPVQDVVRGPNALTSSTWTHLATTYDGAVLRLYVNGSQVATRNVSGAMPNSSQPLQIGGHNVWSEWFQGQLDDLRVYNRALSASEIVTDMNTPAEQAPPAPPAVDTQAPSLPAGLAVSGQTQTGLTLGWSASTDNVGVTGYSTYRNGTSVGSTAPSTRTYTFSGLTCGTTYQLGVDAVDAAGNRSARGTINGTTSACSSPPPGGSAANIWVDANGGTCADSAGPVAYSDAAACSWAQANSTCDGGDSVLVKGGSYGNLTIRGSNGRSSACTFRTVAGETVTAGSLNLGEWQSCSRGASSASTTNWFSLVGPIRTTEFHADCSNQVLVDGLDMDAGGVQRTQPFQVQAGATNFTMRNSKVHNSLNSNAMMVLEGSNFVLDNNDIYDGLNNTNGAIHDECLRAQPVDNMTMTRNHFWSCAVMDVFITGTELATNWLVENNIFEAPLGSSGNAANAFAFRGGGSPSPSPDGFVLRYNTFGSTGVQINTTDNPVTSRGFTVVGNYFATNPPCGQTGAVYAYNISPSGVSNCGGSGAQSFSMSSITAGFLSYRPFTGNQGATAQPAGDYRLTSTSPLINKGNPANYPALDKAGTTRFVGTAPDAGAYEGR